LALIFSLFQAYPISFFSAYETLDREISW
jgi:hypothetical protein